MNSKLAEGENSSKKMAKISLFLALEKFFSDLPERSAGIIKDRYGIESKEPKTLEEIGKEYNITRERVRQIIRETFKKLKKKKSENTDAVNDKIKFTIEEKNDIMKKEVLLSDDLEIKEKGSLKFFLDIFGNFSFKEIQGELEGSWATESFDINEWRKIKNSVKEILEKIKNPLTNQELLEKIKESGGIDAEQKKIFDYLEVSSEIKKGSFEKWGLKIWDEITPKGTKEKIYLILKETGKPLHFKEIAGLIDKHKLNKKKKTHPQTIHNELIRDKRFILVGRGIYALSEWGYSQGTVKEVIEDILKKNAEPMEREEIINRILNARKVKKSTVLINLNNFFEKVGKKRYYIKK
jgi:DNA-directed RNA polymerase delta subunit